IVDADFFGLVHRPPRFGEERRNVTGGTFGLSVEDCLASLGGRRAGAARRRSSCHPGRARRRTCPGPQVFSTLRTSASSTPSNSANGFKVGASATIWTSLRAQAPFEASS